MKKGVVAVINYNGKILIGKKRSDSSKKFAGMWHIPGEGLNLNESVKSGLLRLMREELCSSNSRIKTTLGKCLGKSYSPSGRVLTWYECFVDKDNFEAGSDLEEIKWVDKNKVLQECNSKAIKYWPKGIKNYFNS